MDELKDIKVRGEYDFLGAKTFLGKKLAIAEGFMDNSKKVDLIAERLDNYSYEKDKILGPLRSLVRRGTLSEADFEQKRKDLLNLAQPHLDGIYQAIKRLKKVHNSYEFDIPGVPVTEEMKRVGRNKWTADRVVSYVLNMGNESSHEALINSYGYKPEQEAAILAQLSEKEFNAIQGIWDVTNTLFPELDAVHFRIYNHHLVNVEARPFNVTTNKGKELTLRGGYYPLMFDHDLNRTAKGQKIEADAKRDDIMANRNTNVVRTSKLKDGATFSRTQGHGLPPLLSFSDVWFTHVNDVIRYTTHAEYLRDFNRLIKRPRWAATVDRVAGFPIYKQFASSVSYQALPERRRPDGYADAILDGLRRSATAAILGLKAGVGIKQRVSQINAVEEIGWKYIAQGYMATDLKNSIFGLSNSAKYQMMIIYSKVYCI